MTLELFRVFLGWCLLLNFGFLLLWFAVLVLAKNWVQGVHGRWFKLEPKQFDLVWYQSFSNFKLGVILFNLAPYVALCILAAGGAA